ncbi:MAG: hypothetical protein H7Z16_01795 [Pyrinomonadaceae bacterium]|nr:hypothetical protein [Pyrinomonadaceae bacterium]
MRKLSGQRVRFALVAAIGACLLLLLAFWFQTGGNSHVVDESSSSAHRLSRLPSTILWAWERPENLDYIDQQRVAVAFLAKTIYLRADTVVSRPRLQPLAVPAGVPVIAVARIESERAKPATLSPQQIKETAREISELSSLPNVVMVQVDFDATLTERNFYRSVLIELRAKLPESTLLSITALASWCKGDNWLDDLPIDEAVPMLFRMGVERNQFLSQLAAGDEFNAKLCQASLGISTDEPLTRLPPVQRVYVFNPESWSPAQVNRVMEANAK